MTIESTLKTRLEQAFAPTTLQVINESDRHNVPPGSESHFKVVIVSDGFEGARKVQRHQRIYAEVNDLLAGPIHALALHTYTTTEWQERGGPPQSPNCLGGENPLSTKEG